VALLWLNHFPQPSGHQHPNGSLLFLSHPLPELPLLLFEDTSLVSNTFNTFDLHALLRRQHGGVANFFIRSKEGNKFFGTFDSSGTCFFYNSIDWHLGEVLIGASGVLSTCLRSRELIIWGEIIWEVCGLTTWLVTPQLPLQVFALDGSQKTLSEDPTSTQNNIHELYWGSQLIN
jgi:hypothetical protein